MSPASEAALARIKAVVARKEPDAEITLDDAELTRLERAAGLAEPLPEEYRRWLLEVADTEAVEIEMMELTSASARPFPLTEQWVWEDDDDADPEEIDRVHSDGSVLLKDDGCGMRWVLVVTGPERGQVWQLTGEGAAPAVAPDERDDGYSGDFLTWFEFWLNGGENWWE